jgi:hypothetical protein
MAREKAEKLWIGGGVVAAVVLAAAVWMFAVNPELTDTHNIRSQTTDTQAENSSLEANVSKLQAAYAGIGKLRATLTAAHDALPASLALSEFTQQISAQARRSHVSVTTLTAGAPGAVDTSTTTGTTPTATPSSSDTSATTTGLPPTSGLYAIPINVAVAGKQSAMISFVRSVQHDGPRAALVSAATLVGPNATTGDNALPTLTLQMQVFVASDAIAPTAAATTSTTP